MKNISARAFTFIELLFVLTVIALLAAIILAAFMRDTERRMRRGVVFSQSEATTSLAGKVFRLEHFFTNSHKQVIILGETIESEKSITFLSNLPQAKPVSLTIGKYYTPVASGFAEVVGSATEPSPVSGQY